MGTDVGCGVALQIETRSGIRNRFIAHTLRLGLASRQKHANTVLGGSASQRGLSRLNNRYDTPALPERKRCAVIAGDCFTISQLFFGPSHCPGVRDRAEHCRITVGTILRNAPGLPAGTIRSPRVIGKGSYTLDTTCMLSDRQEDGCGASYLSLKSNVFPCCAF